MPALHGMEVFSNFQILQIRQNKPISFVLDRPSRSHVGITSEFKVLIWTPVSEHAKQINMCKGYIVVGLHPGSLFIGTAVERSTPHQETFQCVISLVTRQGGSCLFFFFEKL